MKKNKMGKEEEDWLSITPKAPVQVGWPSSARSQLLHSARLATLLRPLHAQSTQTYIYLLNTASSYRGTLKHQLPHPALLPTVVCAVVARLQVVEREPRVPGHISTDMLAKAIEMQNKKLVTGSKEEVEKVLRGMTHLHLNGQGITTLGPELYGCSKLETLYLYDNRISEMPSFHRFKSLSVLNLRNNFIVQMSGLEACDRLAKLYLDGNCIQVSAAPRNCRLLVYCWLPF